LSPTYAFADSRHFLTSAYDREVPLHFPDSCSAAKQLLLDNFVDAHEHLLGTIPDAFLRARSPLIYPSRR
jgi:hypothetical protein